MARDPSPDSTALRAKAGAWVDLGLTLPIFIAYHLGVVFLGVKNAADFVTGQLLQIANGNTSAYLGMTIAIGIAFAIPFILLARGQLFQPKKFIQIAIEGILYATLMGVGVPRLVGAIFAGKGIAEEGRFVGFIMSLGAGFYEELIFRVVLFGLGGKAVLWLFAKQRMGIIAGSSAFEGRLSLRSFGVLFAWAIVAAALFSGVHYVGAYADSFELRSFVARLFLGLALTLIFVTRGFAAAVWTHAVYDIWVLVLRV